MVIFHKMFNLNCFQSGWGDNIQKCENLFQSIFFSTFYKNICMVPEDKAGKKTHFMNLFVRFYTIPLFCMFLLGPEMLSPSDI